MRRNRLRSLQKNCDGTTIIEFAIVAPIFLLILMAAFEYGLMMYTQVALETAVDTAGRNVMVNSKGAGGCASVSDFTADVKARTASLINGGNVAVTANTVATNGGGGVSANPDICLTTPPTTPPTGSCSSPPGFYSPAGHAVYVGPDATNVGCSGDEVELEVILPWAIQFPLMKQFFPKGVTLLTATTVIKNE